MLRRRNSLFALVMLFSFTVMLLPKNWWHDCDHTASHTTVSGKHQPGKVFKQGVEKCAACDLQIPLLSAPAQQLESPRFSQVEVQAPVHYTGYLHAFSAFNSLRGPPVKMS